MMKVNLIVLRRLAMMSISKDWKNDMKEEMDSLFENKTWELVKLPKGRKTLQNKWVYKSKHQGEGKKERYKARLVVKGFS